ncbi:MAG: histidine kinase dimerization/phospho-acceptor domain-containing protein [Hyphomonadaceae bacterium]
MRSKTDVLMTERSGGTGGRVGGKGGGGKGGGDQLAVTARERRLTDFVVMAAAVVALLAGLAIVGELNPWAAGLALVILAAFGLIYYFGTADLEVEAMRAAREAAIEAEKVHRVESERGFRKAIINALPEPSMYIDAQGRVEAANAAARRQFRFVGAEPLLTVVVRRPELLDAVQAAASERRPQMFEFIERGDTDRYFSCVAAPLQTPGSAGVLVAMHDLTELRRAEFARVDFLANASHELRTPLTSLSGFIETLRGPARDDAEARDRFLDIMHGQAERMRRLISDLLSLSRIELIEHRTPDSSADLAKVVAEVVAALGPVAQERGVSLRVQGPSSGVMVSGVHDELSQVAQNLIDNAIKYSETSQTVDIQVEGGLAREKALNVAGRQWEEVAHMSIASAPRGEAGRFAILRVADAGPGISRQHLPRLAERFYRVDQGRGLRPGTGLGLAIVKHVVTRHRGEFLVESELGSGAAFGVVLAEAPERAAVAPRVEEVPDAGRPE